MSSSTTDRWSFYLRHSINDLRVNGKRTIFALLCIAAGVAAIVSLQTLAVMIGDTLTGNLQESNRGDIKFRALTDFDVEADVLETGVKDGVLSEEVFSFFGNRSTQYRITLAGVERIQSWADEAFPGRIQITYRRPLSHPLSVFTGSGTGASLTVPRSGKTVSSVNPIVVQSAVYPFYSQVESRAGKPLGELLQNPNDIVLSQRIADKLDIEVGTSLRISGSDVDFVVRGVVKDENEVKSPGPDFLNALYGFYYLDVRSMTLFDDVDPVVGSSFMLISDVTPEFVAQVDTALRDRFPYLDSTTTEDLRQDYRDFADTVHTLVSLMGLLSLLIGCIGIINTMQVIVRRRMIEVAVLKTIGLQGNQVTVLFLVEAFIMGVLGSLGGIVLGWLAIFAIKGGAETLLATHLSVQLVPSAAFNGFVVGVLVTTVFGFLPTLTAGRVRPSIVLRPTEALVPRAGFLLRIGALIMVILTLSVIASTILGSFGLALGVISGAFVTVGFLYLLLHVLVWLMGRLMPSFGIVELKISLRQMLAARARAAVTMLALVIGVFCLSLITLVSEATTNLLEYSLGEATGGNVAITVLGSDNLARVEQSVANQPGLNSYLVLQGYSVEIVGVEEGEARLSIDDISRRMQGESADAVMGPGGKQLDMKALLRSSLGRIDVRDVANASQQKMDAGRALSTADEGRPVIVLQRDRLFDYAGIDVGDRLVFQFVSANGKPEGEEFSLEIVGLEPEPFIKGGFASSAYSLRSAFPDERSPTSITVIVDIEAEQVANLRKDLLDVPGTVVLEIAAFTRLITSMLDTFTAFPLIVATLGLVVGGIVIANSVALSTMERRREIAVMKSVGLQRERVLAMLLTENAIMGLIAGLLGVGIGLVGLIALSAVGGMPSSAIPYGSAFLLMGLCILVAVIAALTTAWGASGEKPLNVLRYE